MKSGCLRSMIRLASPMISKLRMKVVLREADFVNVVGVAMDALNRLKNMAEIVGQMLDVVAHTGSASASTAAPLSGAGASVCNFARPIKRNLFHRPIRPIHNIRTSA